MENDKNKESAQNKDERHHRTHIDLASFLVGGGLFDQTSNGLHNAYREGSPTTIITGLKQADGHIPFDPQVVQRHSRISHAADSGHSFPQDEACQSDWLQDCMMRYLNK